MTSVANGRVVHMTAPLLEASGPGSGRDLGVWAELIGQTAAVATLQRAVAGEPYAMSHAWLFTGPPGSGRSNAARAFAAALQCSSGGCGKCTECRTSLSGAHPDVTLVRTELLSIGVDEVRELVRRSAMSPTLGRWQVIVIEDADRITERGADALLKSIEEPAFRTVWILCAPTIDGRSCGGDCRAGRKRTGGTGGGFGIRHEGCEAAPSPGCDQGARRTAAGPNQALSAGCD
jgi:DNA polymerase-3 subunit delta'